MNYKINPDWWTILRGTRFECTQCGKCCERPGKVFVKPDEIEPVAGFLGLTTRQFIKKFTRKIKEYDGYTLRMDPQGQCPFYSTNDNTCGIHPVKFIQCRTFPFWPEHVETPDTLSATKEECEGIGRGNLICKESTQSCLKESAHL